jgi:pimeloyl-ACP methyl ester carboxylesterase
MTALHTGSVEANGIRFHYLEAGQGPLVLCLHGFPDNAYSYRSLLPALAEAGLRGVAPFMRGYAPTAPAPDGRYQSVLLAQDAVALISALGAERACVVGHDWGALATYGAAALAADSVQKIVTIAVAHPGALLGAIATDYDMIKGGWHAYFFQMPFSDQAVAANDYEFIRRWWQDASPEYDIPDDVMDSVKNTFRQPGVVNAALDYYRHTFNPDNRDPALQDLQERLTQPTRVPSLALHGTKDRPGRLNAFNAMDHLFANRLDKEIYPGTGHFLHLERPQAVNQRIIAFLKRA